MKRETDDRASGHDIVVGAYEARTKFSEFLGRAERGENFVITKNGREVARLTPVSANRNDEAKAAGQRILARLDARYRGEFDFEAFWSELKQERDERADRWHSS